MEKNKYTVKIVGSFASEYSIAKTNRNVAHALQKRDDVEASYLWADKTIADKLPSTEEYKRYPFLKDLFIEFDKHTDIAIVANFPKNPMSEFGAKNLDGDLKLAYLAWEDTVFPANWVKEFNENLHGVLTTSKHVSDVLKKSGVSLPMEVIGNCFNPYKDSKEKYYNLRSNKNFKFLHISSAHYRKGIDVLLNAYVSEFSSKDDVSLVLKIFTNSDSQVYKALEHAKKLRKADDMPEIILIDDTDFTDGEMLSLFNQTQAYVAPSRAEGFGMPMAEALMMGKPLITTAYSGQMDFCNDENSFLINYQMVESKTHLNLPGSMVAEPDLSDLKTKMRFVYENINSTEIKLKVENGLKTANAMTWENVAEKLMKFSKSLLPTIGLKDKSIAIISTINSKCGLAEYVKDLYLPIRSSFKKFNIIANTDVVDRLKDDEDFVIRTWKYGDVQMVDTIKAIKQLAPDILHIHYHPAKFSYIALSKIVDDSIGIGIKTILTLHNFDTSIKSIINSLNKCLIIYVHSQSDKQELDKLGLQNVRIFLHGINSFGDLPKSNIRKDLGIEGNPVIATHGLIHDKKGFVELISSIAILKTKYKNIKLLMATALAINNVSAQKTYKEMQNKIKENNLSENVIIINDYLEEIEIVRLLQTADIIVLPYADLNEGASGAITKCFSAMRPIIVTKSAIFKDVSENVLVVEDNHPVNIANGIENLLENQGILELINQKIFKYLMRNSWQSSAIYLLQSLSD